MRIVNDILVVALLAGQADAANYYVSTSGSNANSGTSLASPFLTIQQAANVAQAGDNVYVRGGTYRETVTAAHSGNSSAPITFQPYNNEQVTVSGLDVVGSSWSPYSGSIYQTTVASGGASQLFVNGQMMTEARWPNAGAFGNYSNPLHGATYTTTGATNQAPLVGLSTVTDSAHLTGTPDWTGAHQVVTTGQAPIAYYKWATLSRLIVSDNTSTGTLSYTAGNDETVAAYGGTALQPLASGGNPYYITGSLAALDVPKEWYYDSGSNKLYLQAPGSVNPGTLTVEARKRQYGFDLGSQNYIQVKGISLKAANVNVGGNHNLIDNCQILYPTPYTDQAQGSLVGAPGVQINGQYNTIRNSEVGYSWGDGITITNMNNTVSNNVIHDVDWAGDDRAFVNTSKSGGYNTITGNTMYNAGRDGVAIDTWAQHAEPGESLPQTVVEHNDISRYGRLIEDGGGVHSGAADCSGTTIAYNRINASSALPTVRGIQLDSGSDVWTSGTTIHHNLILNGDIGVALITPLANNLYNNTIWGCSNSPVFQGSGSNVINNLSNASGDYGWGSSTNASNNRYQTANQFTNSAAGDYTLTANSSGSNMGATYKRAVNYGTPIPGITDGYTGSAPDAGAFESGVTPWTAGASWKTWTAGNQTAALLASAVSVTYNSTTQTTTRTTTGSLMVGNTSSTSANNRSFLQFDLSGVVATTIQSAILRIYENTAPTSAAGSVTLNRVTSAWTNSNVSYGQSVDTVTPITGFYDPSNLDLYTDINITSWVQGWLSNSSTNYGLRLCGTEDATGTAKYFDGFYGVTAPQLVLTMPEPGDANLDGKVDVSDLAILAANYRKYVTGGWTQADFNNDGVVDVKDLAILAANYRYGVSSDVVPAYDGLDAAAMELLSQAGVTVVPEPCTLLLLGTGLIGLLAYAWRKRR